MNLFELLKQFKDLEPDRNYREHSRRIILATPRTDASMRDRWSLVFFRGLETSLAVVLAGFFILLITGNLLGSPSLAPVQYSVIDPQGLRAEANAVDMQIELANLTYLEVTSTPESTSKASPNAAPLSQAFVAATSSATSTESTAPSAAQSSTATTSLTINQALKALSQ